MPHCFGLKLARINLRARMLIRDGRDGTPKLFEFSQKCLNEKTKCFWSVAEDAMWL